MSHYSSLSFSALCQKLNLDLVQTVATALDWDDPKTTNDLMLYASKLTEGRLTTHRLFEKHARKIGATNDLLVKQFHETIESLIEEVAVFLSVATMLNARLKILKMEINPGPSQKKEIENVRVH